MPARKDAAGDLAEKLLQVLLAQRLLGPDSYPLPLRRLAELTDPAAPPDRIRKAIAKKKQFAGRVVLAQPKDFAAPVALVEDVDRLAASPLLLEFLLESVCTPARPLVDLAQLRAQVSTRLKKPLESALRRQIQENTLPGSVSVVSVREKRKEKTCLHLRRYPLPREPDEELAERLVRVLRESRAGGSDYPLSLGRLVQRAQPGADVALVTQAIARPLFQGEVVLALHKPKDLLASPAARAGDEDRLADSPLLLEAALLAARSAVKQVCTIAELKKKVIPALQQRFEDAVRRRIEVRSLPAAVGCLAQGKGKQLLFLMRDVSTGASPRSPDSRPAAPAPAPAAVDFARAFEDAFRRLEQQARMPNFVSLVDLRRTLACDRARFDAGLRQLRLAGRYTLSAAEGRHGLRPEEQEAGIVEDGALLLYVSRKLS